MVHKKIYQARNERKRSKSLSFMSQIYS